MVCMRKKAATHHQGLKWHYPYLGQSEHPVAEMLILTRQSIFTSIFPFKLCATRQLFLANEICVQR